MDREVPWDDADDQAKRSVSADDLLVIVLLDDLFFQLELGQTTKPSNTSSKLILCKHELDFVSNSSYVYQYASYRLALFLREQLRKVRGVLFEGICKSKNGLLALLIGDLLP